MTVIVCCDGVMAADSATFMGDIIVSEDARKIHRTPDGSLVGCAGARSDIELFYRWADGGFVNDQKPSLSLTERDFGAILLTKHGMFKFDHRFNRYQVDARFAAESCHEEFVVGCLMMGASAEKSVQMAIDHCIYAGGRVVSERLSSSFEPMTVRWSDAAE